MDTHALELSHFHSPLLCHLGQASFKVLRQWQRLLQQLLGETAAEAGPGFFLIVNKIRAEQPHCTGLFYYDCPPPPAPFPRQNCPDLIGLDCCISQNDEWASSPFPGRMAGPATKTPSYPAPSQIYFLCLWYPESNQCSGPAEHSDYPHLVGG